MPGFSVKFRVLIFVFLVVGLSAITSKAQDSNACVISALSLRDTPSALRKIENSKPKELSKFDFSGVTEGTRYSRNIRIPGTDLYTYVEVFFDDDMKFHGNLTSAISIYLLISKSKRRTQNSVLSFAVTQSSYDDGFKQIDLATRAKNRGKLAMVQVVCTGEEKIEPN